MKSTGIIRGVDHLGRLVIPKEIRTRLNIQDDVDSFEIFMEGNSVILRKYEPTCVFCGNANGVISFNGKNICQKCIRELSQKL